MEKSKKLQFLETLLRVMASALLKKYKPKIVGITGSVGKTSAKEAVFAVLSKKFPVRKNEKNYNNEIGIPLTIIGVESGGRSLIKWIGIMFKWLGLLIFPCSYPEILVLEMGVDRPGDMDYLLSFIKPTLGVVTNISASHIEFFQSLENIAKEKGKLIQRLPEDGFAILNADDERALKLAGRTKAPALTFGFSETAQIYADHVSYNYAGDAPEGISFKLNYDGTSMPIRLGGMLARHQIYGALAGVAAGIALKMNLVDIASAFENFFSAKGRLNLIDGINGSSIIDDTYNASPVSTLAALGVLAELKAKRKIAILGDMLELGEESERDHQEVVKKGIAIGTDMFFAVGKRMQAAARKATSSETPVFYFDSPDEAAKGIERIVKEGDLVLVKGSQGMRMEKIVFALMKDKAEAEKLLCRHSPDWLEKPFTRP